MLLHRAEFRLSETGIASGYDAGHTLSIASHVQAATYLLLQLEPLPVEGPPGLLASLSEESVLQLVGGSVPQRRH